jgi:hypothetical protein
MSKQLDPLGKTAPELHSKGTIVIIGDSWARGEWYEGKITHLGLQQYLLDYGYDVINLGIPAGSNSWAIRSLQNHLLENGADRIVRIFHFWSEWHRDFRTDPSYVWDMIDHSKRQQYYPIATYDEQLVHRLSHRMFEELQKCARAAGVSIGLIGGCSDVINVGNDYPGLYTACESMTNLCLTDDHTTSDPVFSVLSELFWFIEKYKANLGTAEMACLVKDMEKGAQRLETWTLYKEEYFSDCYHANRIAHKKLFDLLVSNNFV